MTSIDRRRLLRGAAASAVTAAVATGAPAATATAADRTAARPAPPLGTAQPLDDRPFPSYDYTRANKLPREMTGYWEKSFAIGGTRRTAKVYLSPETPIRSYFTVLAVPDGVDTAEFLRRSGWRDTADEREEGLFVLEPGEGGWTDAESELAYVEAAMGFFESNRYFSVFGEHYLVGYGFGAPPLEAWAVAHPLRVIAQVHLNSRGLRETYLNAYAGVEFDGRTAPSYTPVVFPDGFRLIRHDETVLPTWYIGPDANTAGASLSYWKRANDTLQRGERDGAFGTVYRQRHGSGRWMTSHAGPISQVAVEQRPTDPFAPRTTDRIVAFLTRYTRYENFFAYGNQLNERADYRRLGVEVRTMTVEGQVREYLVHVPRTAHRIWRGKAPVVFVWPGNSQTDKVFMDAAGWWEVAEREGCVVVTVCEQYSATSVSVSHRDSLVFFRQLREVMLREYPVDPGRLYSTGQSAGSGVTQTFAIAFPEHFAAVASTSFTVAPDATGTVSLDGVAHPARHRPIPTYQIYGFGDLAFLEGGLWDGTDNRLDTWARYHLDAGGLTLAVVDTVDGALSGWQDRYQTWTWHAPGTQTPLLRLTKNNYRSHNTMPEETPLLWGFLRHYRHEARSDGTVARYYSASGFRRRGDEIRLRS
ncbi:hypothetical protein G6045_00720 [Streptomyces sp. YC504]|uniref:Poly(3-hydroxybutyrate) depolymerase n=1 Tax=Streptomyces mesophilus TaxID=1775132 RepID=A0A6G4X9J8_9ACTN|nr:hypothetical protein [Streptomyces mesophilus]NGO74216.1 hypothetical protein [Streptomyces mesophilus]